MPTINPSLVPTVAPGNLFRTLTSDSSLSVRWLTPQDPCMYSVLNRPHADTVLRQLVLAKTLDFLSVSLGYQSLFPFLIQPRVVSGSGEVDIPTGWIWDLHMSTPTRWRNFRLAKIKRLSGLNSDNYTGTLRLIFTANLSTSTTETALFYADYIIDSPLDYQRMELTVCDSSEEDVSIPSTQAETISGFITFRTLDSTDPIVSTFYTAVEPPTAGTDADSNGYYDTPAEYEVADTVAGGTGVLSDFSLAGVSHGTGILVDSTNNPIPQLDSDVQSWLNAMNYPFDVDATLIAIGTSGIRIPAGLFREFDITAPAGDEPTDMTDSGYFPVWISRVVVTGTSNNVIRFVFATKTASEDSTSTSAIEFAQLDLTREMVPGQVVSITPIDDLLEHTGSDDLLFQQHFGRGHVVLSDYWGDTSAVVTDFFDQFDLLPGGEVSFAQGSTRLSSFAVSRVPRYAPTIGQSRALAGSTSRLTTPIPPSEDNLYVTEQDQGLGNRIDLEAAAGITPVDGINRYGYSGSLAHRMVYLCLDNTKIPTGSETGASTFYVDHILPRLVILLGRAPIFGDVLFTGTEFMTFNGDTWQS